MYHDFYSHKLNLQLFADGGAAGGNGTAGAEGSGVNAPAAGVQTGVEAAPNTGDGAPSPEVPKVDRKAEFERLIKGEYKDLYDARVKDIVQKRLRGPAEAAEKYRALDPVLGILAMRYGLEDRSDIKSLTEAVKKDTELLETLAFEKGKSPEAILSELDIKLREESVKERENAIRAFEDDLRKNFEANQRREELEKQAATARNFYPSLDLVAELENPVFEKLLDIPGISVQTAYEVVHKDEINAGLLRHATQVAAQQVAASVAANGVRPNENGAGAQAATVKLDPSKMTKAQRQEYIMRARRGEKIVL